MSWVSNRWQLLLSCGPLSKMDRAIQDCSYNSKEGSLVWGRHRQGPVLCKAGQRGVQDSTQEPLKVCLLQGQALLGRFIRVIKERRK